MGDLSVNTGSDGMEGRPSVNEGAASAVFPGTHDGVLLEHSGELSHADRMMIRKRMRRGVDFEAYGTYPDGVLDGFVFTLRPISHDYCEAARQRAQDHFGKKLWGEDWRDKHGANPIWPPAVVRMIRSRWMLSSVIRVAGPVMENGSGPVSFKGLAAEPLRAALKKFFCPDYDFGKNWDEERIMKAYDDSDYDEDFIKMIERMHNEWVDSIDAPTYLAAYRSDPTRPQFLASPGRTS